MHKCLIDGCTEQVSAKVLLCTGHWFFVPKKLRDEMKAVAHKSPYLTPNSHPDWLAVAKRIVSHVERRVGKKRCFQNSNPSRIREP